MRWSRELIVPTVPAGCPPLLVLRWTVLVGGLVVGIALAALSIATVDGPIVAFFREHRAAGDVRRELEAMQQFGAIGSVLMTTALIGLLDPKRLRRMLDYGLAIAAVTLIANAMKWTIGRGRPRLGDPMLFLGPMGEHAVREGDEPVRAWELAADGIASLHAMPSTHTSSAVVLGIFLATLYPRLRWFSAAMIALVASARVILTAHWPSDVIVGAALAFALGTPIIQRCWGVRLLDGAWRVFIDRNASPALPGTLSAETGFDSGRS